MSIAESSFRYVADLVRRETSMLYEQGKEYLVEARLLPLAREAGDSDVDVYVSRLMSDAAERRKAIDALTINETSWFRDNAPYQAFTEVLLPRAIAANQATRRISIWSAACSSGQEAYSLSMLLDQHLPLGWTAEILATDVSTAMLERVKAGRYSQVEMNRGLPATHLVRYFTRVGSEWEVSADLRRIITTQHLNLATTFPPLPTFDIVFLRNVLIYFDLDTKRDILRRVHARVSPHGSLLLGSSETTLDLTDSWEREAVGRVQVHRPVQPAGAFGLTAPTRAAV
ncbi:protein-glutamate O-methyltransferase CheR [Nocardioides sp.]|uniref:CheR family methyltransferase n=1 Tax=Nocardioides sp. TaxID=35761 RepID=UPI00286BF85D|nr:protein-glutamate O-methyltransferase CheR [Nocardioides sp.]